MIKCSASLCRLWHAVITREDKPERVFHSLRRPTLLRSSLDSHDDSLDAETHHDFKIHCVPFRPAENLAGGVVMQAAWYACLRAARLDHSCPAMSFQNFFATTTRFPEKDHESITCVAVAGLTIGTLLIVLRKPHPKHCKANEELRESYGLGALKSP